MKDILLSEMGNIYISSEQIIAEVKKFQCLYDPAHPDHRDRDVMKDAWQSVTAAVVGEPWEGLNFAEKNEAVREVQKRWKNLRDRLRRTYNTSEKTPRRPYMYYKELSFLIEAERFKNVSDTDDTAAAPGDDTAAAPGYDTAAAPGYDTAAAPGDDTAAAPGDDTRADEQTETTSSHSTRVLRPKRNSSVIHYLEDTSAALEADELRETSYLRPATRRPTRPKRKRHKPRQIIQTTQKGNSLRERGQSVYVPYNASMPGVNNLSGGNHQCCQNTSTPPEPENPDRMFLLSLLPRVSALSSRNKLDFQIKAMQMMRGYNNKDDSKS